MNAVTCCGSAILWSLDEFDLHACRRWASASSPNPIEPTSCEAIGSSSIAEMGFPDSSVAVVDPYGCCKSSRETDTASALLVTMKHTRIVGPRRKKHRAGSLSSFFKRSVLFSLLRLFVRYAGLGCRRAEDDALLAIVGCYSRRRTVHMYFSNTLIDDFTVADGDFVSRPRQLDIHRHSPVRCRQSEMQKSNIRLFSPSSPTTLRVVVVLL